MIGLYDNVTSLKGVGEKKADCLKRLGIINVGDLVANYPRTYEVFDSPVSVAECPDSGQATLSGVIISKPYRANTNGRTIVSVWIDDGTAKMRIFWFNDPWIIKNLKQGERLIFRGRVTKKDRGKFLSQPKIYNLGEYSQMSGKLLPVYSLTAGISNLQMRNFTLQALDALKGEFAEYLPEDVVSAYTLRDLESSIHSLHFPRDTDDLVSARRRIIFDEFFIFILTLKILKTQSVNSAGAPVLNNHNDAKRLMDSLPYKLTDAQVKAFSEISCDLSSGKRMTRLLQGDVGSGKTVVAALSAAQATAKCGQAILIAPTLVLAEQHYRNFCSIFSDAGLERKIVLLTGQMSLVKRRQAFEDIADGSAQIIIGTHALLEERVHFNRPVLAIIDEQHRFGVKQREILYDKNFPEDPKCSLKTHLLFMSATPIPRTLAITLYGEQSVSILDEKPSGRLPIKNCVVGDEYHDIAWSFIEKQVSEGRQCYVICPMIEKNDITEAADAISEYEMLKKHFKNAKVGLLHGRLKAVEKEDVIRKFAEGKIDILVSTTVVEVGVDVPNATVMLVENAEYFGLAQLHQLRGRIGRGQKQSYCIFFNGSGKKDANKRLNVLLDTNDGFKIASKDLELRGPGDLFGIRQSGELNFKLADIYLDAEIMADAARACEDICGKDPKLNMNKHTGIRAKVGAYLKENSNILLL